MEAEDKNLPEAAEAAPAAMEGTETMGYWDFKKGICNDRGWQLRRIDSQSYDVIDAKHEKIGMFKSGEGYFPNPVMVADQETPPESA